jgi:hypothetical protein
MKIIVYSGKGKEYKHLYSADVEFTSAHLGQPFTFQYGIAEFSGVFKKGIVKFDYSFYEAILARKSTGTALAGTPKN